MGYVFLSIAIMLELLATNLLKASAGFSLWGPSLASLAVYGLCFYFLAEAMKSIDLSVAYALWAGLGVVLTTLIAVWYWKEPINVATVLGISLIVVGVVILNLYGTHN